MKPTVVFFSRSYQAKLFPLLVSENYEAIHVTLTRKEKRLIEEGGVKVTYCFETFSETALPELSDNYLHTSLKSDRFLQKKTLAYRQNFLNKEVAFWTCILDNHSPIAVVNEQVAIEIAEVMYVEAKKRGIRYLAWMTNPVNGYFYWIPDPISLSLNIELFSKKPSAKSLSIANTYINSIIIKQELPFYILPFLNPQKTKLFISAVKGVIKHVLNTVFSKLPLYEDYSGATWGFFERSFKSFYFKYDSLSEILGNDAVLYPLHYEPEASLSYLSEFFSDQVALIDNLAKCLTHNQVLVVKEHPAQIGMLLTSRFQKLKQNNPQVLFLPATISSYEVINVANVIITLTSHLGWEALILGKPVFLLGKMFYDKYPCLNRFESFEQLRETIRNKNYVYPIREKTVEYIANLLDISYNGNPFPNEQLYSEENIRSIVFAIEKELGLNHNSP